MKHTKIDYTKLQQTEISELKACLEKHGGFYNWDEEDAPYVRICNDEYGEGSFTVEDARVDSISIDKNGDITLAVTLEEIEANTEFSADEVFFGDLDTIMDALPEPD